MGSDAALLQVEALRSELTAAVDVILSAAERGLALKGPEEALALFGEILEACAIGDLGGQRLATLAALLKGAEVGGADRGEDGLLNGPAQPGRGLSQAEADALF